MTSITVQSSKKEYPLQIEKIFSIPFYALNEGNSQADSVTLIFTSTLDITFNNGNFNIGNIAVSKSSKELILEAEITSEKAIYEIPYTLSWLNLNGEVSVVNDSLKILPQRYIDWAQFKSDPYTISSIKDYQPEKLKGRSDKLMTLRMGFDSMESFFITGQKRVGKSSIANVYYGELKGMEAVLPVHFLWGDVADCSLPMLGDAICKFIAETWNDKTKSILPFTLPTIAEFNLSFSRTFSDFLRSFHRNLPKWKIIFIIDDFDEIREDLYKGEIADAFFTTLRAFIDRDFTSFIIVGSENLTTTILREQGRKLNQADILEVDHLDNRRDLEELITMPANKILYFDQEAVSLIIGLTAGNPYYTNLLCSRIYRLMFSEGDYYVSKRDVEKASIILAKEDREKSYSHFWSDGIQDTGEEKIRISYNNAMVLISISKSEQDTRGYSDIRTINQQPEVHHLESAELEYRLNELADRKVIERDPSSTTKFRIKVKVFDLWLQADGSHQIRQSFGQYVYSVRPLNDFAIFPQEILNISQGLTYRGENIDRILVETWLRQFGDEYQQRLAYKLLSGLKEKGYYTINKYNNSLELILKKAIAKVANWASVIDKKLIRNVLVTHADPLGKSGPATVTEFRRVNNIYSKNCGTLDEMVSILNGKSEYSIKLKNEERWILLFVDNFVGTGISGSGYIIKAFDYFDNEFPGWDSTCYPFYGFVCGFSKGAETIESSCNNRISVIIADPLEQENRAFSPDADIFCDDRERSIAKAMVNKIGLSLEKKHPLGYENSEALIVFPDNVPNNTLPIFIKKGTYEGKLWTPLFPRV